MVWFLRTGGGREVNSLFHHLVVYVADTIVAFDIIVSTISRSLRS